MPSHIEPGMRVRHPDRPDWGDGQVQSVIGDRVTVNFPEAGKVLINAAVIELTILEDDRPGHGWRAPRAGPGGCEAAVRRPKCREPGPSGATRESDP